MRYSTYRFSLDLHKHQSQMSIAVFQYDTACRLYISLTDGGIPYLIEDGCRAVLYARRPDNTPLSHNCMIEGNSRIIYDFLDSTAAVQGIVDCQIRLYGKDGDLITAPRFIIVVEERAVREYEIELEDDTLSAIDEIFLTENERVEAEQKRGVAESARVDAEQKRANAETLRANAEEERITAEATRAITEEERNNSEEERQNAEQAREESDKARGDEETGRRIEEQRRQTRETGRVTSEAARAEAEQERVRAEIGRANAEAARAQADVGRDERIKKAIDTANEAKNVASLAYRVAGSVSNFDDLPPEPIVGTVYNVIDPFVLDGKAYPGGTNVVWTEHGWDALGGMIDLSLVSQWDLIITDPADLATKLANATGNVLVKLSQPYKNLHYIQFNEGLKLIDFGGSYFRFTYFTANPDAKTVIKNIKTVITQEELWEGLGNGTLKNFGAVENCRGVLEYVNCSSIENCDIKYAESCNYIRNCSVPYSEYTTSAVFKDCCFINNVDVSNSEPVQNIEVHFDNCHHISNIHDDGAEHFDHPTLVTYDEHCTFVDPYTCAGYITDENAGKVPVPNNMGGMEFKEFAPIQRTKADSNLDAVYVAKKSGGGTTLKKCSPSYTGHGVVPIREAVDPKGEGGQIAAPNQITYPPDNDEYISFRFLKNYLKTTGTGGGAKLYRHDIEIAADDPGVYCFDIRLVWYGHSSTPATNWSNLPIPKNLIIQAVGHGYPDGYVGEEPAIVGTFKYDDSKLYLQGLTLHLYGESDWASGSYYLTISLPSTDPDDADVASCYINDTVTEVT